LKNLLSTEYIASSCSPAVQIGCELVQDHFSRFFLRVRAEVVSAAGFEPATHALKGRCSTN
jgi:hypothetical protein